MKVNLLAMWTVYARPSDYPDKYVARRFEVDAAGVYATQSVIITPSLEFLRDILATELHLTCLPRDASDDPNIVETWM